MAYKVTGKTRTGKATSYTAYAKNSTEAKRMAKDHAGITQNASARKIKK